MIENEDTGLDYAVVVIGGLDRAQLEAGGAAPIARSAWADHVTEHDHWALVGVPSESVDYDGESIVKAKTSFIPLEPVNAPPEAKSRSENQFYARLKTDPNDARMVKDLDGMSGGPIFAFKKVEGIWRYAVIGVQSGWYRDKRIIAACPFSSLGFELEKMADERSSCVTRRRSPPARE